MRPRVLIVSRWLPSPPDNGARIRREQLLGALVDDFEIDYVALLDDPGADAASTEALGVNVHRFRQPAFRPRSPAAVAAWFGPRPRAVVTTHSRSAAEFVAELCATREPAVLIADEIHTAHYAIGHARPVLVEEIQLAHLAEARGIGARLGWVKNRAYHRRILEQVAAATTPSERERSLALELAPRARVEVIANGVDIERLRPADVLVDPDLLVYAGSPQYAANLDAIRWFAGSVLGRVRAVRPAARLVVTGATDGVELPSAPGLEFCGHVEDLAAVVRGAACSVVPLRIGGGTRIKVLEALALGTPVVATAKGVEGLGLERGVEIDVADDPEGLARAITDLLGDPRRRADRSAAGRAAVVARHSWTPIRDRYRALVGEVAAGGG